MSARPPRSAALAWLALSAVLLGASIGVAYLAPDRSRDASDPAAALGGARPAIVGGLFLRAEALKHEGRVDELPAIYRRILSLDPDNEFAVDYLAETLARDLRTTATTDEGRVAWWTEADALVTRALERSPSSVRLLWRRADLLLVVADGDPAVAAHLARAGRDREKEAIESLREAARLSGSVPRLGRIHLVLLATNVPRLAAARLATPTGSADAASFLAIGADVLRARRADLADITLGEEPRSASADDVLEAGLALVAGVLDALHASPPDRTRAREIVDRYVSLFGEDRAADALRPLLR